MTEKLKKWVVYFRIDYPWESHPPNEMMGGIYAATANEAWAEFLKTLTQAGKHCARQTQPPEVQS